MSYWTGTMMMHGRGGFDPNTPIGTFIEGGYFTGIIMDGGAQYAIIVAPKASGENSGVSWKNANSAGPIETRTLTNGLAATLAMVAAGSSSVYPAAHWANDLSINGFDDWYLPARDELELIWRNLKPVTNNNDTTNREKSSIVYVIDDESGDTQGINRNSDPVGAAYTATNPAQTSVALFQSGGAEAMAFTGSAGYLTSSELSGFDAWRHSYTTFAPGRQIGTNKTTSIIARAVRRVAL